MADVLKFKFDDATGTLSGPAEYMHSESYRETARRVEAGTHVLIGAPGTYGVPTGRLIEVIFQTDYAAWRGARELAR